MRGFAVTGLTLLGVPACLVGFALVLQRLLPRLQWWFPGVGANNYSVMLSSFIGYGSLAWLAGLAGFALASIWARRRGPLLIASGIAAAGLILQLSWLAPYFVADRATPRTDSLVVAILNAYQGPSDAQATVEAFAEVDVAVVVELSQSGLSDLDQLGWQEQFRYSYGRDNGGTAIFSRFPITGLKTLNLSFPQAIAQVSAPGIGPVSIVGAHPCNTFCSPNLWVNENQVVFDEVRQLSGPVILAGDFNSVDDHLPMLNLRQAGFRCTADLTGGGLAPTWPAGARFPPVFAIDHILVNDDLTATAMSTFSVRGTDHLGVRATIATT